MERTENEISRLIVDHKVIVEYKAAPQYNAIFEVQTLTYLRLTGRKLGIVMIVGDCEVAERRKPPGFAASYVASTGRITPCRC